MGRGAKIRQTVSMNERTIEAVMRCWQLHHGTLAFLYVSGVVVILVTSVQADMVMTVYARQTAMGDCMLVLVGMVDDVTGQAAAHQEIVGNYV